MIVIKKSEGDEIMNAVIQLNEFHEECKIVNFPTKNKPKKCKSKHKSKQNHEKKCQDKKVLTPVQPFKTEEDLRKAKEYFLHRPERYKGQNIRDWCIFILGINIARRAGDLLRLKISDILDENNNIKKHITIKEQKTGKVAQLIVTPTIENALNLYLESIDNIDADDYLFPSRNKDRVTGQKKAMTVVNFYYKLQQVKTELGLDYNIGTHSMRKTWGYATLRNNKDDAHIVAKISKVYNHSNIETTFRYLGIEQEEIDETFMNNQL